MDAQLRRQFEWTISVMADSRSAEMNDKYDRRPQENPLLIWGSILRSRRRQRSLLKLSSVALAVQPPFLELAVDALVTEGYRL